VSLKLLVYKQQQQEQQQQQQQEQDAEIPFLDPPFSRIKRCFGVCSNICLILFKQRLFFCNIKQHLIEGRKLLIKWTLNK
jgi:hypothetical protein